MFYYILQNYNKIIQNTLLEVLQTPTRNLSDLFYN